MDVVNTVVIGVLVSAIGLILARITRGESATNRKDLDRISEELGGLRQDFRHFRVEIKADLHAAEQRLDGRIDGLQVMVDGMRSDLTRVALAVGVEPRGSNG